jgi:magnesium-transporting ATPase (P-type)
MNNIDYLIESVIGNNMLELDDNTKNLIISNIKGNTGNGINNEEDKKVNKNNKKIFKNSMIILSIILLLVILLFVFFMIMRNSSITFFQNFEFIKIFKESMIILVFVGLTEFCFLYFFGRKYIVIEPNLLKKQVVDQLNEYSIR